MTTVDEWNLAFDLLWNNIASDKAPGLEKYEKSVFLTQAQEEIVLEHFSARSNALQEGIDDSARRQADFSILIKSATLSTATLNSRGAFRPSTRTKYYQFPTDALIVLNEEVTDGNNYYSVVPLSHEEYARLIMKPYKYPPKGQVWRLITSSASTTVSGSSSSTTVPVVELIGKFSTTTPLDYRMRYVQRPQPIILGGFPTGLSVNGSSTAATCMLPEHLHDEILQRAIMLAKISWIDTPGQQRQ